LTYPKTVADLKARMDVIHALIFEKPRMLRVEILRLNLLLKLLFMKA
jgi:hypothetical protein